MKVGYARISTVDQSLISQEDDLKKAGCENIFSDVACGAKKERPGFDEMMKFMRPGDTLIVWKLDRLGRTMQHLIETVAALDERGIGFVSLQESIDTSTPTGKLMFHLFGALAEFERALTIERTHAGLRAARARGRFGGRPMLLDDRKIKRMIELYDMRKTKVSEISQMFGIKPPTFYLYRKKYLEKHNIAS